MINLQYWYGDDIDKKFRSNALEILNVKFGPTNSPPDSFEKECIKTARAIYAEYPNIHIALSGGWESNVCLDAFIRAGIMPGVYILQFPMNLNSQDSNVAIDRCKQLGILPKIIDVKLNQFVAEHMLATATKYQTYSFFQALHAYCIETLDEDVLLVDKLELRRDINPTVSWSLILDEDCSFWPERFNLLNNKKIINNFYTRSPKLMYSFLTLPAIVNLVNTPLSGKLSLNTSKNFIYRQCGFGELEHQHVRKTVSADRIPGLQKSHSYDIQQQLNFKPRRPYISYEDVMVALENQGISCQYI